MTVGDLHRMATLEKAVRYLALTLAIAGGLALIFHNLDDHRLDFRSGVGFRLVSGRSRATLSLSKRPPALCGVQLPRLVSAQPRACLRRNSDMRFPPVLNRVIDVLVDALMLLVAGVLTYQHWLGTLDKLAYGETSFILRYPVWWAYALGSLAPSLCPSLPPYCLIASIRALVRPDDAPLRYFAVTRSDRVTNFEIGLWSFPPGPAGPDLPQKFRSASRCCSSGLAAALRSTARS